jgi:hypothetical protein
MNVLLIPGVRGGVSASTRPAAVQFKWIAATQFTVSFHELVGTVTPPDESLGERSQPNSFEVYFSVILTFRPSDWKARVCQRLR